MPFGHSKHGIYSAAVKKTEVAAVQGYLYVGKLIDEPVEHLRAAQLKAAFAGTRPPHAVDHLIARLPPFNHLQNDLGRILQIGVNNRDALPGSCS